MYQDNPNDSIPESVLERIQKLKREYEESKKIVRTLVEKKRINYAAYLLTLCKDNPKTYNYRKLARVLGYKHHSNIQNLIDSLKGGETK